MKKRRIDSLEALRCLAFLGIFVSHCGYNSLSRLGPLGVCLFYVLSGFVMTYSYIDSDRVPQSSVKNNLCFAWGKIKKLYPLHIVTMLLIIPLLIYQNISFCEHLFFTKLMIKVFIDIFLLKAWFPTEGIYFYLNGVAWYLSVSVLLYFAFPWIIARIRKLKSRQQAIRMSILLILLQALIPASLSHVPIAAISGSRFLVWLPYIFPVSRLVDFVVGCNLCYIYLKRVEKDSDGEKKPIIFTTLEIIAFALIFCAYILYSNPTIMSNNLHHVTIWILPVSLTIYLFALNRGFVSKLLVGRFSMYIARLSAYTFLIHQIVIRYFHTVISETLGFDKITHPLVPIAAFCVTLTLSQLWIWATDKIKCTRKDKEDVLLPNIRA